LFASAAIAAPLEMVGYGVTANGSLFSFDPDAPATATTVGSMGIVPEGIDFRPGTSTLYAIDVGPATTQLYTVNTATAAVTPVGVAFPSISAAAPAYDLTGNQRFGFDFNPRTLQGDGSVRIRLVSTNGVNLRLNSDTGAIAVVDLPLLIGASAPFVDGAAYTNSYASTAGGATTLYDMDTRNDSLYIQNPPNDGTLTLVGPFGVTINATAGIGFDIVSFNPADDTLADERALAAFARSDGGGLGYLLYDVNLSTGATTGGRAVGGGLDFPGGLAVRLVPEPTSLAASVLGAVLLLQRRRRQD
jgi:hypothetical protein